MPREIISLACGDCQRRNYTQTKNRRTHPDRLELKKYCPRELQHTPHKESRKKLSDLIETVRRASRARRAVPLRAYLNW